MRDRRLLLIAGLVFALLTAGAIVAGIDWAGALAPVRARHGTTFPMVGEIVLVGIVAMGFFRRRHDRNLQRESKETFRVLVDNSVDVVFSVNTEGRFTFLSKSWERHLGYSSADCLGQSFTAYVHPDDVALLTEFLATVLRTRQKGTSPTFRARRADGAYLWVIVNGDCYVDPDGALLFIGVGRDITQQKQSEDALHRFKAVFDNASFGAAMADLEGNLTYVNPCLAAMHGYRPEELIGKNRNVFYTPDQFEQMQPLFRRMRDEGGFSAAEVWRRRKDGGTFPALMNGMLVRDAAGAPTALAITLIDITERKRAEAALRESEDRYEQLAEQSRTVTWEVDAQGLFTYVSPVAETVYGYRPDEMIGRLHFFDLHAEAGREAFIETALNIIRSGKPFENFVNSMQTKDGRPIWLSTNGIPLFHSDGTLRGYRGSNTDITERKNAEIALRESEARYEQLAEQSRTVAWEVDNRGVYTYLSPVAASVYGYRPEELVGRVHYYDLHPEAGREEFRATTLEAMRREEPFLNLINPMQHKDGHIVWLSTNGLPLRDSDGSIRGYRGSDSDVTDRVRAEHALRESEALYHSLVDNVEVGITLIDPDHNIVAINAAQSRLFHKPIESFIGRKCYREFEKRDAICPHCPGVRAMAEGRPAEVDTVGVRDDGGRFHARIRACPLYNADGAPKGFIETVQDVTVSEQSRKLLEQAKEAAEAANRAKSDFLANMSHEIRTPMTAILGYADLLLEENAGRASQEYVAVIKRNGEHLLQLIGDILDLSKVESGKMQIEPTRCSPVEMARELAALMGPQAAEKNLQLKLDFDDVLPETILTDPLRLRQVLVNLLGNAIKFTDRGEVRLAVRFAPDDEPPRLRFDVSDTGIGMDDSQMAKLFQPFTQVDSSTTRSFGGTGLGLCISKRLTEALGGEIQVRSAPGRGSTFSVLIDPGPLEGVRIASGAEEDGAVPSEPAAPDDSKKIALHGRILLAEDGVDNQRLIGRMLRKAGAWVRVVENGRQAVEAGLAELEKGRPFDLILMDMQMPVMDGYAAARELRDCGYTAPIVALTAHSMREDRRKCLDARCDDYLAKPFERADLLRLAARYVPADPGAPRRDDRPAKGLRTKTR